MNESVRYVFDEVVFYTILRETGRRWDISWVPPEEDSMSFRDWASLANGCTETPAEQLRLFHDAVRAFHVSKDRPCRD